MWRPRVPQIKITENSTAELQSVSPTQERGGGERGREMNEKERKRRLDKERENILPLCQYNIYANHAFSICVNFITHKGLIQLRGKKRGVLKPMTVKVI